MTWERLKDDKQQRIDEFVRTKKLQYRYLLNYRKGVYDEIPVGLSDEKLDLELYKQEQMFYNITMYFLFLVFFSRIFYGIIEKNVETGGYNGVQKKY